MTGADRTEARCCRASSAGRDVLVVGSYPPVWTPGAAVTVETVRNLWAEGALPHVAAPRGSAAPLTVAVTGPMAGRRLAHLREVTGAVDVVLCAERDLPIPTAGFPSVLLPVVQRITLHWLLAALAQFDHVTLIGCGDHGTPPALWARLVFAADVVIDRSDAVGTPGLTTLGPSENTAQDRLRRTASTLAPKILGRHTPRVRRMVVRMAHRGR